MPPAGLRAATVLALGLLAGCADGAVEPQGEVRLTATEGDGVFALAGATVRLTVTARREPDGVAVPGVAVRWAVVSGPARLLGSPVVTSDADGRATALIEMGTTPGAVSVTASLRDDATVQAAFGLTVADRPSLSAVEPARAGAGDTVRLEGRGFSPDPAQNVVLFSRVRAEVIEASATVLRAVVPPCLPAGAAAVDVRFGALAGEALPFTVDRGGPATGFPYHGVLDLADPTAPACLRLVGAEGVRYLAVAASTSTVGAARYAFTLVGGPPAGGTPVAGGAPPVEGRADPADVWHAALREREAAAVAASSAAREEGGARAVPAAPRRVPVVGERRSFQVLNGAGGFDEVEAVARRITAQAVFYVDVAAPEGGYTEDDLAELGRAFDDVIHPTVTDRFGRTSDLDGNERVVVLFTPTVNELTERGSDGYVAGFFYGVDLLPERPGSNRAEIFYAVVPDPAGVHSEPHTVDDLLAVTPPVLAHEFQHMVHFNERVLVRGAPTADAVWLSEGLAQMAEEFVARRHEAADDDEEAARFRDGNVRRAARYLAAPREASLLIGTGRGSLPERGAGWLFVLYLADLHGDDAPGRLTRTTRTGTDNVSAVAGRPFADLLLDWWSALYLDERGTGPAVPPALHFPGVDLPALLGAAALDPPRLSEPEFLDADTLWSSSAAHYIVEPTPGRSVTLRFGGGGQGAAPQGSGFRLRLIRLQGGP